MENIAKMDAYYRDILYPLNAEKIKNLFDHLGLPRAK